MNPMPEERDLNAAESPAPGAARRRVWWWVRLALVLGMIAGIVIIAKPARLWQTLASAKYLWAVAAVPFAVAAVSLDALKLYWLMKPQGFRGGWWAVARTNLVVNFVSLFLPGTLGGSAVAWYRLSRPDNLRAQTFVALTVNTVLKLVVVAGAGALALALDARGKEIYQALILPLLILAALPLVALALMLWTGSLAWLRRIHADSLARFMPGRIHDAATKMLESLEAYRSNPLWIIGCLGVGIARKLCENLLVLIALQAVGVEVDFIRLLWIMCAVEAIGMTPLTLTGVGLPQVTYVGLLAAFSVGADRALASQVVAWVAALPLYLAAVGIMLTEPSRGSQDPASQR